MEIIEAEHRKSYYYLFQDYLFRKSKSRNKATYYICSTADCKGKIISKPNKLVVTKQHNHPPDFHKIERIKFRQELNRQAQESNESLRKIYEQVCKKFPVSKMIPYRSVESRMRRARLEVRPRVRIKEPIVEIPLNSDFNKNPASSKCEKESQNIDENCTTEAKCSLALEFTANQDYSVVSKNLMPTDLVTSKNFNNENNLPFIINVSSTSKIGEFSGQSGNNRSLLKKNFFTNSKQVIPESPTKRKLPLALSFTDMDVSSDTDTSNSAFSSSPMFTETIKDNPSISEDNLQSTEMQMAIMLSTNYKHPPITNSSLNQIYQAIKKLNGATHFAHNSNDDLQSGEIQESIPSNSKTKQNKLSLNPDSRGFPLTLIVPPNSNISGLQKNQEIYETRNNHSLNAQKISNCKDQPLLLQGLFIPFQTTSLPPLCESCTNNWFHTN